MIMTTMMSTTTTTIEVLELESSLVTFGSPLSEVGGEVVTVALHGEEEGEGEDKREHKNVK